MIISASRRTDMAAFYAEPDMNPETTVRPYKTQVSGSTALIGSPAPSAPLILSAH